MGERREGGECGKEWPWKKKDCKNAVASIGGVYIGPAGGVDTHCHLVTPSTKLRVHPIDKVQTDSQGTLYYRSQTSPYYPRPRLSARRHTLQRFAASGLTISPITCSKSWHYQKPTTAPPSLGGDQPSSHCRCLRSRAEAALDPRAAQPP